MAKGYVRAVVGVGAGVLLGAAIAFAFGASQIGVLVGAIFGSVWPTWRSGRMDWPMARQSEAPSA